MLNKQSIELQLLVACCQSEPDLIKNSKYPSLMEVNSDPVDIEVKIGRSTINEALFIRMSSHHGILPLVYKTLKSFSSDHETISTFKQQYVQIAQRNMLMSAELIRIMKLLEKNGIEALAFKGPVLAQMAYADITLRQYADLDILIKKENIYKVDTLLEKEGYTHFIPLTPEQQKRWVKYAHDIGYMHKGKRIYLEMHWSFLDQDEPMQLTLEDFWKETQKVKLKGHAIPTFTHENLLYYLCIHGSKHLWERIGWIKDLDMLLRQETIDWDLFSSKIENSGFEKMVYLGLHLSVLLFNSPLPEKIQIKIQHFQEIHILSAFVLKSWETPSGTFAKTSAMLKLFPTLKAQLFYLYKIILKPSTSEYAAINFPQGLYWGYYLVRPYLLIKKYISKKENEKNFTV